MFTTLTKYELSEEGGLGLSRDRRSALLPHQQDYHRRRDYRFRKAGDLPRFVLEDGPTFGDQRLSQRQKCPFVFVTLATKYASAPSRFSLTSNSAAFWSNSLTNSSCFSRSGSRLTLDPPMVSVVNHLFLSILHELASH